MDWRVCTSLENKFGLWVARSSFLWLKVPILVGHSCCRYHSIPRAGFSKICLNVGPIINGYVKDDLVGLGMIVWKGRELYAAREINREELSQKFVRQAFKLDHSQVANFDSRAPSVGHCNTIGTVSTMNVLAEALGIHEIF